MLPALLDLLSARFTFVMGKGGVGKTTTASALALSLADRSQGTHLISTDPAHSVGDLFGLSPDGSGPAPSPCTPELTLEELDARRLAREWTDEVGEAIVELVELGTYLDEEDVRTFVELSLPGADEFMGALRLAGLEEEGPDRIVVDTAPTGHTLRLLDSGDLLEGWVRALEAMAEKAGAVQERLLRRRIALRGEEVLEGLRNRIERFESRVLEEAEFVVVSREEEVVRAETERLLRHLEERGLRATAEVRVGGGGRPSPASDEVPVLEVPWREDLEGCEGLRRWGEGNAALPPEARSRVPASDRPERGEPVSVDFFHRELLFFAGKGGMGKSTCAAACAVTLAEDGSVLLLSTDPAGSLDDLLPPDDDLTPEPPEGLRVRQVDSEAEFRAFRERYREEIRRIFERFGLHRSAALDRRVLESLLGLAPPGIDEVFALHVLLEEREGTETLVVDSAPTGHFLRLVEMPEVALGWTRGALRILLKYRAALGLDRSAEELLHFARKVRSLLELLRDPERTGAVVVTQDSTVARTETHRLLSSLEESGIPVLAILHNRHVPGRRTEERTGDGGPTVSGEPRPAGDEPTPASHPGRSHGAAEIRAPLLSSPLVGAGALREFFSRWERVR